MVQIQYILKLHVQAVLTSTNSRSPGIFRIRTLHHCIVLSILIRTISSSQLFPFYLPIVAKYTYSATVLYPHIFPPLILAVGAYKVCHFSFVCLISIEEDPGSGRNVRRSSHIRHWLVQFPKPLQQYFKVFGLPLKYSFHPLSTLSRRRTP